MIIAYKAAEITPMDLANFVNYIKNPAQLHQVTFQELNSLIEAYPYCQNLHFLAMMKAKIEQHNDFDHRLSLAATYCPNRQFLFKQIQEPTQPQGTSDSYQKEKESPAAGKVEQESTPEDVDAVDGLVLDIPSSGNPPPVDQPSEEDTANPSDETLDTNIKVVEDANGSQIIQKNVPRGLAPKSDKRNVIFLEDLVNQQEETNEEEQPQEAEVPQEQANPIHIEAEPVTEEKELDEILNETLSIEESDAVTDHIHNSDSYTEDITISDELDLHDRPQENDHQLVESISNQLEHPVDANELSEKEIPFEVTNVPEEENTEVDGDQPVFAEEAPEENDKQFGRNSVSSDKLNMSQQVEDEDENELPIENSDEIMDEDKDDLGFTPVPKGAFSSWSSKYGPTPEKKEPEVKETIDEQESDETLEDADEEIEVDVPKIELDNVMEIDESVELSKAIELATSGYKVKRKKKDKSKKKDKKKKKDKTVKLEDLTDPDKKKKKNKSKKKSKKQKIKKLAQKSLKLDEDLISETLASLLVEQGSNKKAVKMYKKLASIFPEKSEFFAKQIKKLKK